MKELAKRFKMVVGSTIINSEKVEDDISEDGTMYMKNIKRNGTIISITDSLIIVKMEDPTGRRPNNIECFNRGDIISRGAVLNNETKQLKYLSEILYY